MRFLRSKQGFSELACILAYLPCVNGTIMNKVSKTWTMCVLAVLLAVGSGCSGEIVTHAGLFENDHKELKQALLGSWQIVNTEYDVAGQEMYEFYHDQKNRVKLKVMGMEAAIQNFDSPDGLDFTFEYVIKDKAPVYVVGQFKSYERKVLVCLQEPEESMPSSLSVINLEKRQKPKTEVVAVVKKN